jgi:hypothetical protein
LFSPASGAQSRHAESSAKVPFNFDAGPEHFAAGTYTLSERRDNVVYLQSGKTSSLIMGWHEIGLLPATGSKMVFHHYGNRYFLREIWTAGSSDHMTLVETAEERSLRHDRAQQQRAAVPASSHVEVALLEHAR